MTADAFLNWVRSPQETTGNGLARKNFLTSQMGMFLRNAVIYRIGMIPHYLAEGFIYDASAQKRNINELTPPAQVRLAPKVDDGNNLGYVTNNNISSAYIYGWTNNDSRRWFAIEASNQRLLWIVDFGIAFFPEDIDPSREIINPLSIPPSSVYQASDLDIIIGVQ